MNQKDSVLAPQSNNCCANCEKLESSADLSKCSRCRKVSYCSSECQTNHWKQHRKVCKEEGKAEAQIVKEKITSKNTLSDDEADQLIKIIKKHHINIYRIIYLIDQNEADLFKSRNTYFHQEHSHKHEPQNPSSGGTCCPSFFGKIYIPEKELSNLEKMVAEVTSRTYLKTGFLQTMLEKLCKTFDKIKQGGLRDKMVWDKQAEQFVLSEVLKEGVIKEIVDEVKRKMQKEQICDSKQPLLLATPSVWKEKHKEIELNFLRNQTLLDLHKTNFAWQENHINNKDFNRKLYKELLFLQMDGKFDELLQEISVRSDRGLWLNLNEMQRNYYPNLYFICEILSSLPYELNEKTQLVAQISEVFQISYFNDQGSYHKKHKDSTFELDKDNGRKLTCLYFCNLDEDDKEPLGKIRVYQDVESNPDDFYEIETLADALLVMKSRKTAYEILENNRKRFIIRYWVNGPADLLKREY